MSYKGDSVNFNKAKRQRKQGDYATLPLSTAADITVRLPDTGVRYHDSRGQAIGSAPTVFGLPLLKPPYGQVVAVDLKTGEHLWSVPHGNTPEAILKNPRLQGVEIPNTGAPTRGTGLLVTSTLLFGGEGSAPVLRAWDKKTGAVVAEI